VNIAADLAAMADALKLLIGGPALLYVLVFGFGCVLAQVVLHYERYVRVLKWLCLTLFAYVATLAVVKVPWGEAVRGILVPTLRWDGDFFTTLVAIAGTTISPYLFFWQAAQNAEHDAYWRQRILGRPQRAVQRELRAATRDVNAGMVFSNAIMYFIILTAAATLHRAGITDVQSADQAAAALRPLAGPGASLLFAAGLVGTGMLGIPVLAGSAAYAIAEAAAWRGGLDENVHTARQFYGVIAVAMFAGMALSFAHVNAIRLLIWSAVVNGLLAPPLIVIILVVCNNERVMGPHRNGRGLNVLGGLSALLMTGAAIALVLASVSS
jgi:Mn2+/Fe2+ NRAMP family transporter